MAAPPVSLAFDPKAVVKAHFEHTDGVVEFVSFGRPVKAESCRIYNRSQDAWQPAGKEGVAIHVRYRRTSPHGIKVLQSRVFFLTAEGEMWKSADATGVRCSDPALLN